MTKPNQEPPAYLDEIPPADMPMKSNMVSLTGKAIEQHPGGMALISVATQEAVAKVQAAILLAKQFPREYGKAKDMILNACQRQGLADSGLYEYARGGTKITGPSIRLAEAIAQNWGNLEFGWDELSRGRGPDGVGFSEIVAYSWDMETNVKRSTKFQVRHWRDTKGGGYPFKDERDIYENNANQAARRLRACILNLIPGDVIDEAVAQCEQTLTAKVNITPERIKNMVELFGALNVSKAQLEKRIQSHIDKITPAQMLSLTKVYNSIVDGMSNAQDWFEQEAPAEKGTTLERFEAKVTKDKVGKAEPPATGEVQAVPAAAIPIPNDSEGKVDWYDSEGKVDWSQYYVDCGKALSKLTTPEQFKAFRAANGEGLSIMRKFVKSWADSLDKKITNGEKS